jgi:hypothetical protein
MFKIQYLNVSIFLIAVMKALKLSMDSVVQKTLKVLPQLDLPQLVVSLFDFFGKMCKLILRSFSMMN